MLTMKGRSLQGNMRTLGRSVRLLCGVQTRAG